MKEIEPVARIYTDYQCKFGIPRQSGLAMTQGRVVFEKKYRSVEAVRGLDGFSHLWLIWDFSEAETDGFSPTVRPPRLGGNERMGVFATRSPFRPNGLGLSCVRLLGVDTDCADAPALLVAGADIMDGTPVYDVKPYLPYADAFPDASGGFTEGLAEDRLEVSFLCDCPDDLRDSLTEVLSLDPRPRYRTEDKREYSFEYAGFRVTFRGCENGLEVTELTRL